MKASSIKRVMKEGRAYTRKEMFDVLREINPYLDSNSYAWYIGIFVNMGVIVRIDRGMYRLPKKTEKITFSPLYSKFGRDVMRALEPLDKEEFVVAESGLLDGLCEDLQKHQEVTIVQASKKSMQKIEFALKDAGIPVIKSLPNNHQMLYYRSRPVVFLRPLVSEYPHDKYRPHYITLEKLIVDMHSEKMFRVLYTPDELRNITQCAIAEYEAFKTKIMRYARRRGCAEEVIESLK